MATLDDLTAEQRAIVELLLRQRQSYADISAALGTPEARVRELAHGALVQLAPVSAERVDSGWRGQVADYILGQQVGPEAKATRGHLRGSEPARACALSLADSLDSLYGDEPPAIPSADPSGKRAREPRRRRPERSGAALSPEARRTVWLRRGALIAAAAVLGLAFIPLIFGQGAFFLIGGDDDEGKDSDKAQRQDDQRDQPALLAQIPLRPLDKDDEDTAGIVAVVDANGQQRLRIIGQGLDPTPAGTRDNPGDAYEVWLYNSPTDAKSLGAGKTDEQGNYQGESATPITAEDLRKYKFIDISREKIDRDTKHSGKSVLRGAIADAQAAGADAQQAPPGAGAAPAPPGAQGAPAAPGQQAPAP